MHNDLLYPTPPLPCRVVWRCAFVCNILKINICTQCLLFRLIYDRQRVRFMIVCVSVRLSVAKCRANQSSQIFPRGSGLTQRLSLLFCRKSTRNFRIKNSSYAEVLQRGQCSPKIIVVVENNYKIFSLIFRYSNLEYFLKCSPKEK